MKQVRVVIWIQILNSCVTGILGVILPLMMKDRSIDIVTIGFVFALVPIISQFTRMLFAIVSDFWGGKFVFILSGFFGVLSNSIYYLAHTSVEFLIGKVTEGAKDGSLWSVNRAVLLRKSQKKLKSLVELRTVAKVSLATGSLIAGFLVDWFSYQGTMLLCVLTGTFVIPLSMLLSSKKRKKFNPKRALDFLDIRSKKRIFKVLMMLFFVWGLSFGFLGGFVLPLFLSSKGFSNETIGVLLGIQVLLSGVSSFLFAERISPQKLILVGGTLYTLILVLLGFSSSVFAGILIITLGIIIGLVYIGEEWIFSKIANKESFGTDLGLLTLTTHIGQALSQAMAGVLILTFGFVAPFLVSGLIFALFYTVSYTFLKD